MSEDETSKPDEYQIELLKASVSTAILHNILHDIKEYSKGAKEEIDGELVTTQKKWWLIFEFGGHSFKEIAPDIRRRVICMWHFHAEKPDDYSIRWSNLNEIEIEEV